jgi:hypothetical protein
MNERLAEAFPGQLQQIGKSGETWERRQIFFSGTKFRGIISMFGNKMLTFYSSCSGTAYSTGSLEVLNHEQKPGDRL